VISTPRRGVAAVRGSRFWTVTAAAALATLFLAIYLPDIGHGFISDDFRWIVESRSASPADVLALFSRNLGFYRPMTSASFALDHALWGGGDAFGYASTNLALCLGAAAALFALARRLRLPAAAALVAAGAWLLNFHAVNMSVLWLSGRTALLAALFSLATAWAMFGGRFLLAGAFALCAMLSKEEAVALPALFSLFLAVDERTARGVAKSAPLWAALVVYLALRAQSEAFWPANAPAYYQFSFSPAVIARNVLEYADRAGTLFGALAMTLALVARLRWADVLEEERRVLTFSAIWIAALYGLTVFLPVRSSLYALLPSLGTALAVGVVAAAARRRQPARVRKTCVALIVLAVVLIPVYRVRNVRWVRIADLSEQVMQRIAADARGRPSGHVVLVDTPQERANFASAFGNLLPQALELRVGSGWTGELVNSPDERSREGDLQYYLADDVLQASPAAR
jgi:hypothetical protein